MPRRRHIEGWLSWLVLGLAAVLALPVAAPAAGARDGVSLSQVEAVYLFKFASFVTWPEGSFERDDSPIVVGVLADPALARTLAQVAGDKRVNGRPLVVRTLGPGEGAGGLHVLFVGAGARGRADELLEAVAGRPVLTVSDDPALHARGTMVNFVVIDQRVRFDVAMAPVRRSGLHVSALMLTAARDVQRTGQ